MIDANDVPYGALYSLPPDYLAHLNHDEVNHANGKEDEVEAPTTPSVWKIAGASVKAFFTKS